MSHASLCWPECFAKNTVDFSDEPVDTVLATQLCAWGNVYMGVDVPDNFFEVMDAASKITHVFTPDECKKLFNVIMTERRNNHNPDSKED